jgi:hypothetical protein
MMRSIVPTILAFFVLLLGGCPENQIVPQKDTTTVPEDTGDTTDPEDTATNNIPDDVLTGGIMGRICAPSQHVYVADAKVSIEHEWGVTTTHTDADGFFILKDIPAGTYVVVVTKGSFQTHFEVFVPANEIIELAQEECFDDNLNIAVVTGEYDHIGRILLDLGLSFDTYNGFTTQSVDFLRNPAAMDDYDIIFLNCGLVYDANNMEDHIGEIGTNIRDYVRNGGSVYASDWAYFITEKAFPDMVDFRGDDNTLFDSALGVAGSVSATVYDTSMIAALGGSETASITFDLDVWITPVAAGGSGSTMVYSKYKYYSASYSTQHSGEGPLAVKLEDTGSVIFTAFHNEAQITLDMETMIREIIFAL